MNYYNEHDKKTAAWLRELIRAGHIAPGEVDERSIVDVVPGDVRGFTQCHWFAGIGGWSAALRLAGWSDTRPVWTGSLPCQPFSAAGQQKGAGDDRHLWPVFFDLVQECRPQRIFGEQVAKAIGFNWLDGISTDLEAARYAVGSIVLGAHSVGAPHIRQRLYWMADGLEFPHGAGREQGEPAAEATRYGSAVESTGSGLGNSASGGRGERRHEAQPGHSGHPKRAGWAGFGGVEHAEHGGSQERRREGNGGMGERDTGRAPGSPISATAAQPGWDNFRVIVCRDGKERRVPTEPAFFPLANGLQPGRVGILRGAGNAIVPACAAAFIEACEEVIGEMKP